MTIALLIAGGMSAAFALGLWLGRTDFRHDVARRERLWRERLMVRYPATQPLTLSFTDDDSGAVYQEAAEFSIN